MKLDGQNSVIPLLFKMVAPRALAFRPLIKGNEDSGNEIGGSVNKSNVKDRLWKALISYSKVTKPDYKLSSFAMFEMQMFF